MPPPPVLLPPLQILEDEKLGGGLALTIAVMYEASLGQGSTW